MGRKKLGRKRSQVPQKGIWTLVKNNAALLTAVLALFGVLITGAINTYIANKDQAAQRELEAFNAQQQRELEAEKAQNAALQTYLEGMRQLLLDKDLLAAKKGSSLRAIATAQTLSSLGQMSPEGKGIALRFLYESALVRKDNPIIHLTGADLSGIDLYRNNLSGTGPFLIPDSGGYSGIVKPSNAANLSGAILSDANLEDAVLSDTDLSEAELFEADLRGADLSDADLFEANLQAANLSKAYLGGADLTFARLKGTDLSKAVLSEVFLMHSRGGTTELHTSNAVMSWANLKNADLSDADLSRVNLSHANLSHANLSGANLSGADLSNADLSGVKGITSEELAQQAKYLRGATMPHGQQHEEWLKAKDQ